MKKLLNTLFVTSEDMYLTLDGENIVAKREEAEAARFPLHSLEGIVVFSYAGASPALMGACARRGIALSFCTPNGRFLARTVGKASGNVLLRRTQYRVTDSPSESLAIAKNMLTGKLFNSRWSIERTLRDHPQRVNPDLLREASAALQEYLRQIPSADGADILRGVEGKAAVAYFGVLDEMILQNKEAFAFTGRNRRPPLDRVNALLSFAYSLLAGDCASALESVGLDSFVGFLHTDRPGRCSLALDLMEELRAPLADRFVLTLINTRVVAPGDFTFSESGAVLLADDARKKVLHAWQERKRESITHPFLKEKLAWGLVPYAQALLLARFLRGDLDAYPPFLWK